VRVLLSWSGGKDSAMALDRLRRDPSIRVDGLLTTVSEEFDRVSMHGVRRELVEAQAESLALPLVTVALPSPPDRGKVAEGFTAFASSAAYEDSIGAAFAGAKELGVEGIAFGDIFLEDLRGYREALLARAGLAGVFPLWGEPTGDLLDEFVRSGFRAIVACVDGGRLGAEWTGRYLDRDFARGLPEDVDPCGENGEYHSFVTAGPGFARPVDVEPGACVFRDPFWFRDLGPKRARPEE